MRRLLDRILSLGPLAPLTHGLNVFISQGIRLHVLGARRVPRHGPLVVVSGHVGLSDAMMLIYATRRRLEFLVNETLLDVPFMGPHLRLRGAYALRRDGSNRGALIRAADAVRGGEAVAIFPTGFSRDVGGGGPWLAARAGAPLLPVMLYLVAAPHAWPRGLVLIGRPRPVDDRRAEHRRLQRRMQAFGSLPADRERQSILDVVLDDAHLWRTPLRVPRVVARVHRLADPAPLSRRARRVLQACRLLRCSVGDVRHPPGVRDLLAWLGLVPVAAAGLVLCGPPLLFLRLWSRRAPAPHFERLVRMGGGHFLILPWTALLWWTGGFLLPLVALAGLGAHGLVRPFHRRLAAFPRVRRHGHRVRRMLRRARLP